MFETAKIIEKWYKKLEFPNEYDNEFYQYLDAVEILPDTNIETYELECEDYAKNLLAVLYMCEQTEREYKKLGISEDVMIATLKDIVVWCKTYTSLNGKLGLDALLWLERHLRPIIFRVGRLQFSKGKSVHTVEAHDYYDGDVVLEIHIPEGEKLTKEACIESVKAGKEFFAKYFPEYEYKYINCHTWLLDSQLKNYLNEGSNILDFQSLFKVIYEHESYAMLRYVFKWRTNKENLSAETPTSSFAKRVKDAVSDGVEFHEAVGIYKY